MLHQLCKMLGETQESNMLKQNYLGGGGGDFPNVSPKVGRGNEHPAPPGMQGWALCVSTLEQQGKEEMWSVSSVGTAGRAESKETGMPAMQEWWKSKCKPGNERKGSERGRENEKGVKGLSLSLQRVPERNPEMIR